MAALNHAQDRIAFAAEGLALAAGGALDSARDHATALFALLGAAVAAAALALSLGGGDDAPPAASTAAPPAAASTTPTYVGERGFSLSLPAGWEHTAAPDGSAFSAASADGLAETTLWVERDPKLTFPAFVDQSMASLDEIGTDVRVGDRVLGATLESRITTLRAEVPLDGGLTASYRVTLRAAGPNRHYLATSIQPGASAQLLADAEIIGSSFRPAVRPK